MAVRLVLTTLNATGTNGLTCLPKHEGARDNKFLVTLSSFSNSGNKLMLFDGFKPYGYLHQNTFYCYTFSQEKLFTHVQCSVICVTVYTGTGVVKPRQYVLVLTNDSHVKIKGVYVILN
jgi:hypothetical protein